MRPCLLDPSSVLISSMGEASSEDLDEVVPYCTVWSFLVGVEELWWYRVRGSIDHDPFAEFGAVAVGNVGESRDLEEESASFYVLEVQGFGSSQSNSA